MPRAALNQPLQPVAHTREFMYDRHMIQNIVFDMGNVLLGFDAAYIASQFAADETVRDLLLSSIFRAPEWALMDAGALTEEDMLRLIPERLPQELVQTGLAAYSGWHLHNRRIPEAETLVNDLKAAGYRLYLLSNASPRWTVYWRDYPAIAALDGHVVSAFVGAVKPDPAIYRILFDSYGLDPAECFFVDDVPANIAGGRALGMDGFVLDRFQYDKLRVALREKGVRI